MFDIVTVVFKDELETLKLQAKSFELYTKELDSKSIYVMVNDDSSIDSDIFGSLKDKVRVVPREIYGCKWCDNGWVSQQVLKIYGAALSSNTWSIVVDAKSFFIRDILPSEIMNGTKPMVGNLDVYPVFQRSKEIAENLFKINLTAQLGPGGVPFVFHNSTIRSMIAEVEQLTGQHFAEWFQDQGMLTEFILYSAFLVYKYGSFDALYDPTFRLSNINVCHSEVQQFDKKFNQMTTSQPLSVSVHRNAWNKLTHSQQQEYQNFLLNKGIV